MRSDIKCFGNDCYPLAFGIPTIIMLIGIIVFFSGTPFYKKDSIKKENIIIKTIGCIFNALKNRIKDWKTVNKKDNWLDYSIDKYSAQMINDVKAFYKVFIVFLPLPIFWALFDQQGSRWTEQAQQLNGRTGSIIIKPDQFQAVNPVFIIVLVPLFDYVIYPLFAKVNLFKRQLQRMAVGFIFTGAAFGIAAFLEHKMQGASLALNPANQIKLINLSPCDISIASIAELPKSSYLNNQVVKLPSNIVDNLFKEGNNVTNFEINVSTCLNVTANVSQYTFLIGSNDLPKSIIFYLDEQSMNIKIQEFPYNKNDQVIGRAEIKFEYFNLNNALNSNNLKYMNPIISSSIVTYDKFSVVSLSKSLNSSHLKVVDNADYDLKISDKSDQSVLSSKIMLNNCGRYSIIIFQNHANQTDYVFLTDIYPNGIHLGWQLIQIFVMTVSEIMVSVSGLSFAYSQAPPSMKSVLQSLWLMTVAVGNLLVVIVAETKFVKDQVYEYLTFTGLILLATIAFCVISYFYEYVEDKKEDSNEEIKVSKLNSSYGVNNPALSESTDINLKLVSMNLIENN